MRKLIDIVYPPACPVCGKPLGFKNGIRLSVCVICRQKLSYIKSPRCLKCGKSISDEVEEYCYDCIRKKHKYTKGIGVFSYTEGIKNSVYRFKYKNKREYASFYGKEIYDNCADMIKSWDADVLIPVPLHSSKYRKRGYNQAELIAAQAGKLLDLPVDNNILFRDKKTVPQKELDDKERRKNVENAFKKNSNGVKYNKVILIDDIYTTGMTMDACAEVLLQEGVEKVYFVCLCIGKGF